MYREEIMTWALLRPAVRLSPSPALSPRMYWTGEISEQVFGDMGEYS